MTIATKIGRDFFFNHYEKIFTKRVIYQKYLIKKHREIKLQLYAKLIISTLISRGNSKMLKGNKNTEHPKL